MFGCLRLAIIGTRLVRHPQHTWTLGFVQIESTLSAQILPIALLAATATALSSPLHLSHFSTCRNLIRTANYA